MHFGKESRAGGGVDPELPGGKGENGVVHLRELLYFRFDLGRAVGAVNVFHHINRTGGAWGIVASMAVGMLMGMSVLMVVAVFMSAATGALPVMGVLVRMLMGMFVLVAVLMSVLVAAALMATAVFCRIFRSVQMFVLFHNYALRMSVYKLVWINI